jgi:hypothetical protein
MRMPSAQLARMRGPSAQGKAPAISRYSPLDLFGGPPELQEAALAALMECPSNNLKVGGAKPLPQRVCCCCDVGLAIEGRLVHACSFFAFLCPAFLQAE